MTGRRILEIGGIIAGTLMIAFGVGALVMSINARNTVKQRGHRGADRRLGRHEPDRHQGRDDGGRTEERLRPDLQRRRPADRERHRRPLLRAVHAHSRARGVRWADLLADGPVRRSKDPTNPAGTSDEAAAAKDASGNPVPNAARNTWVTETALTTALNVSYMAQQIALFGLIVGIALLLSGIGFIILALIVLGAGATKEAKAPAFKARRAGGQLNRQGPEPAASRPGGSCGRAQPALHLPEQRRGGASRPFSVPERRREVSRRAPGSRRQRRASGRRDRAEQL